MLSKSILFRRGHSRSNGRKSCITMATTSIGEVGKEGDIRRY
jgi:hypothetical protein